MEQRKSDLQHVSGLVLSAQQFVYEAKARAEASRARAQEAALPTQPTQPPQRRHNAEAEEMVLRLARKFGGRTDQEVERDAKAAFALARAPATASRTAANVVADTPPQPTPKDAPQPVCSVYHGMFARPDDETLADATWLHMTFAAVPALQRGNLRAATAGRERFARGIWRAGFADVLRLHPQKVASPVGAMVTAARRVRQYGRDVRLDQKYCCSPGWGFAAYALAGVEGLIHLDADCRCQG